MTRAHIGTKIREKRKTLGQTQAALAAKVGISASYLNLIEANKRQIGGHLLQRLAEALGVDIQNLDGAAEQRLAEHLRELSAEPHLHDHNLSPESAYELVSRYPEWAQALVTTYRSLQDQSEIASALADRLHHDPYLGDAVHSMLTNIAAIRSASEILESVDDLQSDQRRRFDQMIAKESHRLADVATGLASYFDKANHRTRSLTPADEVDDFLSERSNHFPALERSVVALSDRWFGDMTIDEANTADALTRRFGVSMRTVTPDELKAANSRHDHMFDENQNRLLLSDTAPIATRRFQMVRQLCRLALKDDIDQEIGDTALLTTDDAKTIAAGALASYAAGALLMDYERFHRDAVRFRYDIELLAHRYGVSFEQACHRLVTLRRPDAAGIPFAFMRSDPAGFITKRFALPRLPIPRYGNACPLWAVYTAFQHPGMVVRQVAELPTGDRFLFIACTTAKSPVAFQQNRQIVSIMLACDAIHADQTIYADGLDYSATEAITPIGVTCRLCQRDACRHREEAPILGKLSKSV
jgi:predicted transcriptional regulator